MGVRGPSAPKVENFFKKSIEIGNVKLKILIIFQKFDEVFAGIWRKI